MKAYAYLRVSSKGQVYGDGLVRQESAISKYCELNGLEVVGWHSEEGVSGVLEDTPALARMLVELEDNHEGVKTVVIERVDRLARDLLVQEAIIRDFKRLGVRLVSVYDGEDLSDDDPTRKLVRQVLGAIAEYDKTMTVLKLKAARDRIKAKVGKCEGRKGYGDTDAGKAVMATIQWSRSNKMSHAAIARLLNDSGKLTLDGKPFTEKNVAMIWRRNRGVRS